MTLVNENPSTIQEGRDYWLHAPAATGGKETLKTPYGIGGMTFSSSGANAYYPYTTYVYPHPLVSGGSSDTMPPAAPSGLSVR